MELLHKYMLCCCLLFTGILPLHSELAYIAKPTRTESLVADALNELVCNPYADPYHLLEQVYTVKSYAERCCGRKLNLSQMLVSANSSFHGFKVPDKHLSSLTAFLERHQPYFEYNLMCAELYAEDVHLENLGYVDVYRFPFNYYDVHEVIDEVKQCQDIAHTIIDEVPPRITIGSFLLICGHLLSYTPYTNAAAILQGSGASFLFEAYREHAEVKQQDKKHAIVDIRKPLSQKHPLDIRQ